MAIKPRQGVLAKVEATYGTDPTPVGTDALIAIDDLSIELLTEDAEIVHVDAHLDSFEHVAGTVAAAISFTTPLRGSGAAGTAPDIGPLLKAVGFSETIVAMTSVTYAPASAFGTAGNGYQSVTLYIENGTLQHQFHGCYGTVSLDASVASFPKLSWEFVGLYEKPTDVGTITSPTYDTTRPVPCRGLTFNIGGDTPRMTNFSLALNRETHMVRDMAATLGVQAFELGAIRPSGTTTIQLQTIATGDWWGRVDSPTNLNWSFAFGAVAGNIATINRPAGNTTGGLKFRTLAEGEDNGVLTLDLGFTLGRHAGQDTFEIVFT